ncbi:phage portal protein, partial [Kordiimonas sp.]|uniref:phage portal protein n=1 Tax=Kordiimonas sp. TaxID=1970157 RepID=UPI003A953758
GLVARACASVPFKLYGGDNALSDHPLLTLLARPNPRVRGENFLYNFVGYHLIAGNAYALAVGPDGRAPKELWLMRPDTVNVLEGQDGLPAGFEQKVAGKAQRYGTRSVLHWKTFNPLSDWYGMAPLEAAALSVDAFNEGSRWNLALIQNGGAPSGVLYNEAGDAPLTDEQFSHLKAEVERRYTGGANAGRPLLLEGGLKWQEMGMSPKDMDWTAAKNMSAREIAMAFGVPPQMLGIPDAQTYSNYSEARQSLWEDTITPMMLEIASELTNWLTPMYGDRTLTLRPDFDDVPALEAKRTARFERIAGAGFLSDAEKRRMLGMGKEHQ